MHDRRRAVFGLQSENPLLEVQGWRVGMGREAARQCCLRRLQTIARGLERRHGSEVLGAPEEVRRELVELCHGCGAAFRFAQVDARAGERVASLIVARLESQRALRRLESLLMFPEFMAGRGQTQQRLDVRGF
jgi:hypothetical protein